MRRDHGWGYAIEIDGGVAVDNIAEIAMAGCDWMVAGSSVFGSEDPAAAVRNLQHAAAEAGAVRV
jgi:ribulose-phosphate 3-epimerase